MGLKKIICDATGLAEYVDRIANEIVKSEDLKDLVFVGIKTRGFPIAKRIQVAVTEKTGESFPVYSLDTKYFRDDLKEANSEKLSFSTENKRIVLVDDVLYTGRTVRAGVSALLSSGRPSKIQIAVIIDRVGFREMPLFAEYFGEQLNTLENEIVSVSVTEIDKEDSVKLFTL